jgi:uncharacterized protein involved in oxidation of intracellular sulfur
MIVTIIINDPPYGTEKAYNAFRLALALLKNEEAEIKIMLMQDAVFCALKEQETPNGYNNLGRMLQRIIDAGTVRACITCMKARGLKEEHFLEGIKAGDMGMLAQWIIESGKVITF